MKEYKVIKPKTNDQWLECRKSGVGSSEIGALLGVDTYTTPYQVWERKTGDDEPQEENFLMKFGHLIEPVTAQLFADATGYKIIKSSAGDWIAQDRKKKFLQVSPDRNFEDQNGEIGTVELKSTQCKIDKELGFGMDKGQIPLKWFCQLQYQLGVQRQRKGALAWLSCGRDFDYIEVDFNADFYRNTIVPAIEDFWHDNVLTGIAPAAINAADVQRIHPVQDNGKTIEADNDLLDTLHELAEIKAHKAKLDARADELTEVIKMRINDAEGVKMADGTMLCTWRAPKPTKKFDATAFKAENPELYEKYMKDTQGARRFLLK